MMSIYETETADLQEQHVALVHGRIARDEIPVFLATAYSKTPRASTEQGLRVIGPPYARYRFEEDGTIDIEAGFPVSGTLERSDDVEPGTLPGGHVAITVHVGPYDEVGRAYQALETYLSKNGFEPAGSAWECYLDGPDVPEPRTRIYLPAQRLSHRRPPSK